MSHCRASYCRYRILLAFLASGCLIVALVANRGRSGAEVAVGPGSATLRFEVVFDPKGYQTRAETGYHLIVWKGGGAAAASLFRAEVTDRAVLAALQNLGAQPGNNLKADCWECRREPRHAAPEIRAEGSPVKVEVLWPGKSESIPVYRLFKDVAETDVDFRFAGNEALIDVWKSGCIACLYSCPGGKLSNAAYTIRDYTEKADRFLELADEVPAKGTRATILLRLDTGP